MIIQSQRGRFELECHWWRFRFLKIGRVEVFRSRLEEPQHRLCYVLDRPGGYLEVHTWSHAYQVSWPTAANWAKNQDEWLAKAQAFRESLMHDGGASGSNT